MFKKLMLVFALLAGITLTVAAQAERVLGPDIIVVLSDDVARSEQVLVYPNPTTGPATLDFVLDAAAGVRAECISSAGVIDVYEASLEAGWYRLPMDFSGLPADEYTIRMVINGSSTAVSIRHIVRE